MIATRRFIGLGLVMVVAIMVALWPRSALACGISTDAVDCVADSGMYRIFEGLAAIGWLINRVGLTIAYTLDVARATLIDTLFPNVFNLLVQMFGGELLMAVAVMAILLWASLTMLAPMVNQSSPIRFQNILLVLILGPIILSGAVSTFVGIENLRMGLGESLFSSVAQGSIPAFGVPGDGEDRLSTPPQLYPSDACPGGSLRRSSGGSGYRMDELAAGYLRADVLDIHCPNHAGTSGRLPAAYYDPTATSPYAVINGIGSLPDPQREAQNLAIQQGGLRQLIGTIPVLVAIAYYALNLIFAGVLAALWLTIPISIVISLFGRDWSWIIVLIQRSMRVIQGSILASLALGGVQVMSLSALASGNGMTFVGISVLGLGVITLVAWNIVGVVLETGKTVSATLGSATGWGSAAFAQAGQTAGQAVAGMQRATGAGVNRVGAGANAVERTVMTGAAALATGGAALVATKSLSFATAAAMGRMRPEQAKESVKDAVQADEIAKRADPDAPTTADSPWMQGLQAGRNASRSYREAARSMRSYRDRQAPPTQDAEGAEPPQAGTARSASSTTTPANGTRPAAPSTANAARPANGTQPAAAPTTAAPPPARTSAPAAEVDRRVRQGFAVAFASNGNTEVAETLDSHPPITTMSDLHEVEDQITPPLAEMMQSSARETDAHPDEAVAAQALHTALNQPAGEERRAQTISALDAGFAAMQQRSSPPNPSRLALLAQASVTLGQYQPEPPKDRPSAHQESPDHQLRTTMATAFSHAGHAESARRLSELPPVRDDASALAAKRAMVEELSTAVQTASLYRPARQQEWNTKLRDSLAAPNPTEAMPQALRQVVAGLRHLRTENPIATENQQRLLTLFEAAQPVIDERNRS